MADIDRLMQSALAPISSEIIKECLPGGQEKPFPHNSFSLMVLTGAKGSTVNHSQVRPQVSPFPYVFLTAFCLFFCRLRIFSSVFFCNKLGL